jgi:phage tail sheath protein FI
MVDAKPVPPSAMVAGLISRTDASHGVWHAPAGRDAQLVGATRPIVELRDHDVDALAAAGVNVVRGVGGHTVAWSARTAAQSEPEWKYVPIRRLALFLEESLYRGLQWTVFEPNGEPLWSAVRSTVTDFLSTLGRQGAFAGARPGQAFFVRCDRTTMTQDDIDHGKLNVVVGVAPLKPAEFVMLEIGLWRRAT